MAFGTILGIASAGMGILGGIGSHNAQVDQVNAENKKRVSIYKQQIDEWNRKNKEAVGRYQAKKSVYSEQLRNNAEGANLANASQQRKLNQLYAGSRLKEQSAGIQQAQAIGALNARQVSGKSANRLRGSTLAAFGRNQAIRQRNLMNANQETSLAMQDVARKRNVADRAAYGNVMFAPTFGKSPLAPTMAQGPSSMNLYAGIGNSLLGGVSTASSLTAPGQGINKLLGIN